MKSLFDNEEGVKSVEALIAWMKGQDIGPTDAVPILAGAIVVAVVSYGKSLGWTEQAEYNSVVMAGQAVVETYVKMKVEGRKRKDADRQAKPGNPDS